MASLEAPVSYLRAICGVVPDEVLEDFLADAAQEARNDFGGERPRLAKRSVPLIQELKPGYQASYDGIVTPRVHTFAANALWVTLFEKRAVATDEVNELLARSHRRLTALKIRSSRGHRTPTGQRRETYRDNPLPGELRKIEDAAQLEPADRVLRVSEVVDALRLVDGVVEYCLAIDAECPMAQVILAQKSKIEEIARSAPASQDLFRDEFEFEPERDPLLVPFMRVPNASVDQHEVFLDNIQAKRPAAIQIKPVEWDNKIRSAA